LYKKLTKSNQVCTSSQFPTVFGDTDLNVFEFRLVEAGLEKFHKKINRIKPGMYFFPVSLCVGDPDVFGPPGSGSVGQTQGYGSGSRPFPFLTKVLSETQNLAVD
jgi:hypothetical protein